MKLVIDIDKNVYKDLKEYFDKEYSDAVGNCGLGTELAIANGTPLEEELEKIKYEIEDTGAYEQEVNGKTEFLKGINYCLSIIDKYKAKSEE